MPSEKVPESGVNSGENQEKQAIDQEIGRAVIEADNVYELAKSKIYPKRSDETDAQYFIRLQLYLDGRAEPPQVVQLENGEYREVTSEEIEHLDGKAPEVRLRELRQDIDALLGESERVKQATYSDGMKAWQQQQIAEIDSKLAELKKVYDAVAAIVPGSEEIILNIPENSDAPENSEGQANSVEGQPETVNPQAAAMEMNNTPPNTNMMHAINLLSQGYITPDEFTVITARISGVSPEGERQSGDEGSGFAEIQSGGNPPTPEEIANAAAAAGGRSDENKMWTVEGYRETTDADHERQRRAYREGMVALRNEAQAAGPGRFDVYDPELQRKGEAMAERETLLEKIKGVKNRVPFKKVAMSAVLGLVAATQLFGMTSHAAGKSSIPVQPQGIESDYNDDEFEDTEDVEDENGSVTVKGSALKAIDRAVQRALRDGVVIARTGENPHYDINKERAEWQAERWQEGNKAYQGFMDEENSQIMENGLLANYTEYESPDKPKNYFGKDKTDCYGNDEKMRMTILDQVKNEPQVMAAVAAPLTNLLRRCGVSDDILNEKNIEKRADALVDVLKDERGSDMQKIFLGALEDALSADNTGYKFYHEYGLERTFYMKRINPDLPATPDNVVLGTDIKQRHGEPQVQITIVYEDGTVDIIDLNLKCGGTQPNLWTQSYEVRTQITEKVDLVTVENDDQIVDVVVETVPPDEGTPPGDDTPPDDGTPPGDDTPPGDSTPPGDQPKNEEVQKTVVEEGGQDGEVDQTEQTDDVTKEPVNDATNEKQNAEGDLDQALDQLAADLTDKSGEDNTYTPDDLADAIKKYVSDSNGGDQKAEGGGEKSGDTGGNDNAGGGDTSGGGGGDTGGGGGDTGASGGGGKTVVTERRSVAIS